MSRSSRIAADPLSDVLSLLNPRGYMSGGVDAGGAWAFHFEQDGYFRCFAIVSGCCWLCLEGADAAVHLEQGDFVVLPHGRAFRLASDLVVEPVPIMTVITAPLNGNVFCWNGGGSCIALSALFTFNGDDADILLNVLPPLLHVRKDADRVALRWYLERMMQVTREPQPGGVLLGEHLAQMMLIEVLGLYLQDSMASGGGWLSALSDKQVSAALSAMHEAPGHRWTLQELAERVGMSRSAFACRFKQKVGTSAMEYLMHWRMRSAGHRLVTSDSSISSIASSLGYGSESAFCFAFKREMGYSPRQYSHARVSGLAAL